MPTYNFEVKCFGWVNAKRPICAKKQVRDILSGSRIFMVEPTFKTKIIKMSKQQEDK